MCLKLSGRPDSKDLMREGSHNYRVSKNAAPHVRLCGKFTSQPHVCGTCGKRVVGIFFWGFFFY
jgi:hypothetical protein